MPYYHLSVIGFGEKPKLLEQNPGHEWHSVEEPFVKHRRAARMKFVADFSALTSLRLPAILVPGVYNLWYWSIPSHRQALDAALSSPADLYHANDLEALPVAAEAAKRNHAHLVFDAHEYSPLEWEENIIWRAIFPPMIRYYLRKYAKQVDGFITVSSKIGERYQREYGVNPVIILNTPKLVILPEESSTGSKIRMIHHGSAVRVRRLERLIETLKLCDDRYSLDFMLVGGKAYINELKELAGKVAPDRIRFIDPVSPSEVINRISGYDMGFYLLEPTSFNHAMAMPNKFFDFIAAGLAVCVGPSPAMADVVNQYQVGCVTPSFEPTEVAETLNHLTEHDIRGMKAFSRQAAKILNADVEMQKLLDLYTRLSISNECIK